MQGGSFLDLLDIKITIDEAYVEKFNQLINDLSIEVVKTFEKGTHDFLVKPRMPGVFPAIVIIHDVWGLNEQIKAVCIRLAKMGYAALAIDLFRGEVTDNSSTARRLLDYFDAKNAMRTIDARIEKLMSQSYIIPSKVATMGFLLGGYCSMLAATKIKNLAATIAFYGRFPESIIPEIRRIRQPIVFFAGGQGRVLYQENLAAIQRALEKYAPANSEIHVFPAAKPGFFDDLHLEGYHPEHAKDAWDKLLSFFSRHIKPQEAERHPHLRKYFGKLGGKVLDKAEDSNLAGKIFDIFEEAIEEEQKKNEKKPNEGKK